MPFFPNIYAVSECWERDERINGDLQIHSIITSAIVITRAPKEIVHKFSYDMATRNANTKDFRYAGSDAIKISLRWILSRYIATLIGLA